MKNLDLFGDDLPSGEGVSVKTLRQVHQVADFLDEKGRHDAAIKTTVRRRTLLRSGLKPERPGAPLRIGLHVVETDESAR